MIAPKTMHPALYRAYQFFVAVKAGLPEWAGGISKTLSADDAMLVQSVLPHTAQQRLFAQMSPNDQRHAIAVAHTLKQADHTHPALMQAALLHDVAKSMGQPIIYRVLIVLFEAFWPAALPRLSASRKALSFADWQTYLHTYLQLQQFPWWQQPFVVHAHHPAIGATWAGNVNCNPLTVRLILRHQDKLADEMPNNEEYCLLAALQWADGLN